MVSEKQLRFTSTALQLTVFIGLCSCVVLSESLEVTGQKNLENNDRQKRDIQETEAKSDDDKRLREFIGKRSADDVGLYPETGESQELLGSRPENEISYDKRFRQFVGKRNPMEDMDMDKRFRSFVGKRDFYDDDDDDYEMEDKEKRLRQFVGKREVLDGSMDKRFRQFVGKRGEVSGADDYDLEKRFRSFVGKRDFDGDMDKRFRQFVGKRSEDDDLVFPEDEFETQGKRTRHFIGKRLMPYYSDDLVKRLREFVGKREVNPADFIKIRQRFFRKPMYVRELVGKRSSPMFESAEAEKRLREFLGKRDSEYFDDDENSEDKRSRQFVGKRLRHFVGK